MTLPYDLARLVSTFIPHGEVEGFVPLRRRDLESELGKRKSKMFRTVEPSVSDVPMKRRLEDIMYLLHVKCLSRYQKDTLFLLMGGAKELMRFPFICAEGHDYAFSVEQGHSEELVEDRKHLYAQWILRIASEVTDFVSVGGEAHGFAESAYSSRFSWNVGEEEVFIGSIGSIQVILHHHALIVEDVSTGRRDVCMIHFPMSGLWNVYWTIHAKDADLRDSVIKILCEFNVAHNLLGPAAHATERTCRPKLEFELVP